MNKKAIKDSLTIGTRLRAIHACSLMTGSIKVGTLVTIREIGVSDPWSCVVRWRPVERGLPRSRHATIHETDLPCFEIVSQPRFNNEDDSPLFPWHLPSV